MAVPVVTVTPNKATPYLPGEAFSTVVSAVDADNASEVLVTEGVDSQNNAVTVTTTIARNDTFMITRQYWQRTGVDLSVSGLSTSGTVPSA